MKGTYHISMCFVCPLSSLASLPPQRTARACRHFIAAMGDMGGDMRADNVVFFLFFFRGRGWQEEWNRGRGVWEAGELLEFEGHHFRSINVRHSALLSDIIKRLSPHSGRQPISHNVCRHLFFSKRVTEKKKTPFCNAALLPLYESPWTTGGASLSFYDAFTGHRSQKRGKENKTKHFIFAAVLARFPSDACKKHPFLVSTKLLNPRWTKSVGDYKDAHRLAGEIRWWLSRSRCTMQSEQPEIIWKFIFAKQIKANIQKLFQLFQECP